MKQSTKFQKALQIAGLVTDHEILLDSLSDHLSTINRDSGEYVHKFSKLDDLLELAFDHDPDGKSEYIRAMLDQLIAKAQAKARAIENEIEGLM